MDKLPGWLAGYSIAPEGHVLHEIETANLDMLRAFYALLALTQDESDLGAILGRLLPDIGEVPLQGSPTNALAVLGLGRRSGAAVELKARLREQLTPAQASQYLLAVD